MENENTDSDLVYDIQGLASVLRITPRRAKEMMRRSEIPVIRIGRFVRVSRVALKQWLADKSEVVS